MFSVGFSFDMKPMIQLQKDLDPAVDRAGEKTGEEVKEIAQDLAHQQTGAMAAGTYVATHEKSGYARAVSAAKALNPAVEILPEAGRPAEGETVVSNVTAQSRFEELGTAKRSPHPFMTPAALQGESIFMDHLENEIKAILPP